MAERTPFAEKWRPMCHPCSNVMLMVRHATKAVTYAPLYVHSFRPVQPHTLVEAEKFNLRYTDPSQIDNTPDKLRWYRYQKDLLQRDVAEYVGMDRSTYSSYEEMGRDYYPIDRMKKLAELFEVPLETLLDEYNLFLYNGQGKQIKTCLYSWSFSIVVQDTALLQLTA